jgi:membrane-bound serine protease (ClpP class)
VEHRQEGNDGDLLSEFLPRMSWVSITFILGAILAVLAVVAALSRHKKSATSEIQLIGSSAQVDSPLGPEGTVLVRGELWRARSADGTEIAPHTIVEVVGLSGHLLLVRRG